MKTLIQAISSVTGYYGISITELSERSGVSRKAIHALFNGGDFKGDTLEAICKALDMNLLELLLESGHINPKDVSKAMQRMVHRRKKGIVGGLQRAC